MIAHFSISSLKKTAFWLTLFAFLLPIVPHTAAYMILIAALTQLVWAENRAQRKPLFWASLLYFLIYALSFFYSEHSKMALASLEVRLAFLVFPLLFATINLSKEDVETVQKSFWLGVLTAALFCMFHAVYMYNVLGKSEVFFYTFLTTILDFHPTYFSWYACVAFFGILEYVERNWLIFNQKIKISYVLSLIFLGVFIVLLSARIGLVAWVVVGSGWFLWAMYQRRKLGFALAVMLGFMGLGGIAIAKVNFLKWRFAPYINSLVPQKRLKELPIDARQQAWNAATTLLKQHPFLGVGAGDTQPELNAIYTLQHAETALADNLNTHSLYLQTGIATGILGLLCLIFLIFSPLSRNKYRPSKTSLTWCLIFAIFACTEALFEVQRGTLFAAFFISLTSFLATTSNLTAEHDNFVH